MIPHESLVDARAWWQSLQADRAAMAKLRRCATVTEAMQEPATLLLFRKVKATAAQDLPGVALTAAVLAHVREDRPDKTVARLIGPGSIETPETALLKPLRFRRLIEADGGEERLTAFRRLVAIAGGSLPVRDLAASLLDWSDQRRVRWVYEYWNANPATPSKDLPA